jgi:hypothetical protein
LGDGIEFRSCNAGIRILQEGSIRLPHALYVSRAFRGGRIREVTYGVAGCRYWSYSAGVGGGAGLSSWIEQGPTGASILVRGQGSVRWRYDAQ